MSTGTVDDVVARMTGSGPTRVGLLASAGAVGGDTSMVGRHVTILGDGMPGSVGIKVFGNSVFGNGSETAAIENAIVRGTQISIQRSGTMVMGHTGTANLTIHYSDFDPASSDQSGPGTGPDLNGDTTNFSADPLFVDQANGDLRLRPASPAIDTGNPAALAAGEPATDFGGGARVVDGDGDGTARRDIGASEYQRRAPQITSATATPPTAGIGMPIVFAATATDPDGDPVTFSWGFDDGSAPGAGASVEHAFAAAGGHQATVTATDSAGVEAKAQVPVTVTPGPSAESILSALGLRPATFRTGKKGGTEVSFTLNVPAKVVFKADRTRKGRKIGGRCRAPRGRSKRARSCTRHTAVRGSFTRAGVAGVNRFHWDGRVNGKALKPGKYRLIGKAGTSVRRAKFRVKRPKR